MADLYVTRAVPNPRGKDRPPSQGPTNAQLNGEWIEFRNDARTTLSIEGVTVQHHTFDSYCRKSGQEEVTGFTGSLEPGQSIRLHSGTGNPSWEGTILHLFVNSRWYLWNNRCGDRVIILNARGDWIDWADYAPEPGEGALLQRTGLNYLS